MISSILKIFSNLTGLINKTPDKEIKERQDEKTDVKVVELNEKEIKRMYRFLKQQQKLEFKAKGIKFKLFEKRPPVVPPGKSIPEVYREKIKELESNN